VNRAFSAGLVRAPVPGALPQAHMKGAPLALNESDELQLLRRENVIVYSANGAASLPAWGNASRVLTVSERAVKARFIRVVASIPHLTFVILNAVLAQELAVFFLKGAAATVFLLVAGGRRQAGSVSHSAVSGTNGVRRKRLGLYH
jgi:hypothetical protein